MGRKLAPGPAAESGASVFKMMEVSRHRSVDTLRGYVRHADLFKEHAGAADREVIFHAENGVIGVGPAPAPAW